METNAREAAVKDLFDTLTLDETHEPAEDSDRKSPGNEIATKELASTSEALSATINKEGKSFFDVLPRELRDAVYDSTFDHVVTDRREHGIHAVMYGMNDDVIFSFQAPVLALRLVSQQFKAEYDQRSENLSKHGTTLLVSNHSEDRNRRWYEACPRLASRCTRLQTTRAFFDDGTHLIGPQNARDWTFMHSFSTQKLCVRFENIEEVHLILGFNYLYNFDMLTSPDGRDLHYPEISIRDVKVTSELRYLGMTATHDRPQDLCDLNVPNIGILDAPSTLAFRHHFPGKIGCNQHEQIESEQIDREGAEQRRQVELAVMEAWIAVHGCAFWQSKRQWQEAK